MAAKQSGDERDELIAQAKKHIEALEEEIGRLMSPPLAMTTLLKVMSGRRVMVASGGGSVLVDLPEGWIPEELKAGQMLVVNQIGAVVDKIDVVVAGGEVIVKRVFDGDMMEIEGGLGGGAALIFKGPTAECGVKPGDTVQLDRTGSVALKIIPKDNTTFTVEKATGVTWDDVGGQEAAKAILREAIEGAVKFSKLFKAYGKHAMKGALLSGPPGCGKSMLAKATANAVRELHGAKAGNDDFIYIKGPEVLNMWVGNTEAQIRGIFARAREHKEQNGYPATIFIDEADAILGKRGGHHASVLSSTIVPTFLAEMDGLTDSGAFVLLATNRQDILDPAIVREGRIDRKVVVGRPAMRESAQILRIHLLKTKIAEPVDELAGATAAELFSDDHLLYRVGLKGKGVQKFYAKHLASGAMLAGIVDVATSIAIKRDAASGKASGLTLADMQQAVREVVAANRNLNHEDDLVMFAEAEGTEVEAVQRIAA